MLISTVRVSNLLELRALQPDNSMNIDPRAACVTIGLVLTSLGSLAAQDQYASAVGVVGAVSYTHLTLPTVHSV